MNATETAYIDALRNEAYDLELLAHIRGDLFQEEAKRLVEIYNDIRELEASQ